MVSFLDHFLRLGYRPAAQAILRGSDTHPSISGIVYFFRTSRGVLTAAEVHNLPNQARACANQIFGFHIHSGSRCSGNKTDSFADAGTHFNPADCPHPHHPGDLPPLFGNHGYAFQVLLTDRFTVQEIISKTIIVHSQPDDFTTQPAGNAGEKIACGIIVPYKIGRM